MENTLRRFHGTPLCRAEPERASPADKGSASSPRTKSGAAPADPQGAARSPPAAHAGKFGEESVPGPKPAATASCRRQSQGSGTARPEGTRPPDAVSRRPEKPGPANPRPSEASPSGRDG